MMVPAPKSVDTQISHSWPTQITLKKTSGRKEERKRLIVKFVSHLSTWSLSPPMNISGQFWCRYCNVALACFPLCNNSYILNCQDVWSSPKRVHKSLGSRDPGSCGRIHNWGRLSQNYVFLVWIWEEMINFVSIMKQKLIIWSFNN